MIPRLQVQVITWFTVPAIGLNIWVLIIMDLEMLVIGGKIIKRGISNIIIAVFLISTNSPATIQANIQEIHMHFSLNLKLWRSIIGSMIDTIVVYTGI